MMDAEDKMNGEGASEAPATEGGAGDHAGGAGYAALVFMILGTTTGSLSQTAMNTMLPSIAQQFGVSVSTGQWLVTVYLLCLGVTIPVVAFLSCKLPTRSIFLGSMGLLIAGSVVMLCSPVFPLLALGRAMQGCATGMMTPLVQLVALSQVPVSRRGTVMGFVGLALGFAPNIGPTVGGVLESAFGWKSFFWFMLALSAVVFAVSWFLLRRQDPLGGYERKLDAASLVLCICGFSGLLLGVSNASSAGATSPACLVPALVGAVLVAVFALRQIKIPNPLLDLHVFSCRSMLAGTVAMCLLYFSFIGVTLVITLELQTLHGYSSMVAGMALLPGTLASLVVNPLAGLLYDRWGPRPICLFGTLAMVVGTVPMVQLAAIDSVVAVALLQALRAFGISALIVTLTTWSLSSLSARLMPDGTSVINALRQISAAFGTSAMVLLMAQGAADGSVTAAGVDAAMVLSLAAAVAMGILCFVFVKGTKKGS